MMPVFLSYPPYASGWVLVFGPLHQLKEEDVIAFVKDLCCYSSLVVIRPSFGQRVDRLDQFLLREVSSCSHVFLHFLNVPIDSFLTGCNDGFEAKLFPVRILARSVFSELSGQQTITSQMLARRRRLSEGVVETEMM